MWNQKKNRGYTLVEVLIAMFIFAILAGIASLSLKSLIERDKQLTLITQAQQSNLKAIQQIKLDFSHIIKSVDAKENKNPITGSSTAVSFYNMSSNCLENCPLIEKVAYSYRHKQLLREARQSTHYSGIHHFSVEFIALDNQRLNHWPPKKEKEIELKAVNIKINDTTLYFTL